MTKNRKSVNLVNNIGTSINVCR